MRPAGLKNLMNTCYANSTLQVLAACNRFVSQIEAKDKGTITTHLKKLMRTMSTSEKACNPAQLLRHFWRVFRQGQQHDALEFLRCMLCRLEEEESGEAKGRNSAPSIRELFYGRLHYERQCLNCFRKFTMEEEFLDLALPFPDFSRKHAFTLSLAKMSGLHTVRHGVTHGNDLSGGEEMVHEDPESSDTITRVGLECLLQHFLAPEVLRGDNRLDCEYCSLQDGIFKVTIVHPPPLLVLSVKHFTFHEGKFVKIDKRVSVPKSLYLPVGGPTESGCESQGWQHYKLLGVIVHKGFSVEFGHYYAIRRQQGETGCLGQGEGQGTWFKCNDTVVRGISEDFPLCKDDAPYGLLYERMELHQAQSPGCLSDCLPEPDLLTDPALADGHRHVEDPTLQHDPDCSSCPVESHPPSAGADASRQLDSLPGTRRSPKKNSRKTRRRRQRRRCSRKQPREKIPTEPVTVPKPVFESPVSTTGSVPLCNTRKRKSRRTRKSKRSRSRCVARVDDNKEMDCSATAVELSGPGHTCRPQSDGRRKRPQVAVLNRGILFHRKCRPTSRDELGDHVLRTGKCFAPIADTFFWQSNPFYRLLTSGAPPPKIRKLSRERQACDELQRQTPPQRRRQRSRRRRRGRRARKMRARRPVTASSAYGASGPSLSASSHQEWEAARGSKAPRTDCTPQGVGHGGPWAASDPRDCGDGDEGGAGLLTRRETVRLLADLSRLQKSIEQTHGVGRVRERSPYRRRKKSTFDRLVREPAAMRKLQRYICGLKPTRRQLKCHQAGEEILKMPGNLGDKGEWHRRLLGRRATATRAQSSSSAPSAKRRLPLSGEDSNERGKRRPPLSGEDSDERGKRRSSGTRHPPLLTIKCMVPRRKPNQAVRKTKVHTERSKP